MKIRNLLLIIGSILAVAAAAPVLADINYTQGAGTVIFDFTCFTTKHCSGHVPINSAGTESATNGNPFRVDPTGTTTQPVSAASLPLPTGAATAANQGTTADAPCAVPTSTTACSEIAIAKAIANVANSATPAGTSRIGYTSDDPCNNASTKVYTAINMVTATNTVIAGVAAKNKYICSIFLYPAAADNVAIYQATTGTSCATAQVAILGGTTTATGFVMTAQAGFVAGTGSAAIAKTTVVNTDICVTTSAAVQLSGVVVTADQ